MIGVPFSVAVTGVVREEVAVSSPSWPRLLSPQHLSPLVAGFAEATGTIAHPPSYDYWALVVSSHALALNVSILEAEATVVPMVF